MIIQLQHGDCIERMRALPDCSIGAIVSDPPYGIEFLGEAWDSFRMSSELDKHPEDAWGTTSRAFQNWNLQWLREAHRVLHPGGTTKIFSATRTFHRLAIAMQEAGLEVLRIEAWAYGSGFPKGLDLARAMDKLLGVERTVVAIGTRKSRSPPQPMWWDKEDTVGQRWEVTAATSDPGKLYEGYNTALKPAWEPFLVGRKPL